MSSSTTDKLEAACSWREPKDNPVIFLVPPGSSNKVNLNCDTNSLLASFNTGYSSRSSCRLASETPTLATCSSSMARRVKGNTGKRFCTSEMNCLAFCVFKLYMFSTALL